MGEWINECLTLNPGGPCAPGKPATPGFPLFPAEPTGPGAPSSPCSPCKEGRQGRSLMFQEAQPRRQGGWRPGWILGRAGGRELRLRGGDHPGPAGAWSRLHQPSRGADGFRVGKGWDLKNQKLSHWAGDDLLGVSVEERQPEGPRPRSQAMR